MYKHLFRTVLSTLGILVMMSLGVVNASNIDCWEGLGTPPTTTYATGIVYGCDGNIPIITIYGDNGSGKSFGVTIKAMNEGATTISFSGNDTNSYGNTYQRGNNYPFPSAADTTTPIISGNTAVSTEGYEPGTYSSGTWIKQYERDSSDNRNLWGGSGDEKNLNGFWGYDTENFVTRNIGDRQAMCPDGYHIPSFGEWNALLYLWGKNYDKNQGTSLFSNVSINSQIKKDGLGGTGTRFSEDMQIPFVKYRRYDNFVYSYYDYGYYWSSSPDDYYVYTARYFYLDRNGLFMDSNYGDRGNGHAIRCFKNSYIELTHSVIFLDSGVEITSGTVNEGDARSENIPTPSEKMGYNFEYRYIDGGDDTTGFDFSTPITADIVLQAKWSCATGYKDNGGVCVINKDIVLEATATEAGQTLRVSKYFNNTYIVDRGDGSPAETVSANRTHTYTGVGTYTITLSLTGGATRWRFKLPAYSYGLIPKAGTTMTGVKIVSMPSLADGFGNSLTQVEDYFFRDFNREGAITSLPEGSFDTSKITSVGIYFFYGFNLNGALTSLPEGSFRFSTGLTIAKSEFFRNFNNGGALTSLPEGSFDISHITTVNTNFFTQFNRQCVMTSLPTGSFRLSSGLTTVGDGFFQAFNIYGQLTSLPAGSFDTSHISSVGTYFFSSFNSDGQITNLPEGSFRLSSGLTIAKDYFFSNFNRQGQLISLPAGSFDVSNIDVVKTGFFAQFNDVGALRILPNGSFKLSTGLTTVGAYFFHGFNRSGSLESLPEGSFNTSQITSAEINFFYAFNRNGSLESLPEGSFDISNITTGGSNHFGYFNSNGEIITLPDSFTINSIGATQISGYDNAFNSPNYTINRKVSDLVSGVTVPLEDMDTFSDNQPGRCGVHANWLVSTADACSISYDDGQGGTGEFKYNADTTGVEVGSGMEESTRIGYTFSGWKDASGNKVEEIVFPDMDGQILNANREINQYTITLDIDGVLTAITGDYGSPVNKPTDPTKNGYRFIGWEPEIPETMPAADMTVKAKWERNGSSGGGGGGGGGGGSSSQSNTGSAGTETGGNNAGGQTGNNTEIQTGSQINSNTGDIASSGANEKEPENGTGNNTEIQTGSQVDSQQDEQDSEKTPQNDSNTQDSSANASEGQNYSQEFQQAYEFAHENGITTMPTIQKAQMNGKLTRIAMAKMLSQYAVNVLGQKPANIVVPKFNDVTEKMDADYDDGVTLAYQLGIMGQNMPNNRFRPNDEVTRAEFATALSRMIYKTSDGEYKGTGKYYIHHMEKLVEEGIITKDDPNMKELRGYVMIMLMRSAK